MRTEKQILKEAIELMKDDLMACEDLDDVGFYLDCIDDAERELNEMQ